VGFRRRYASLKKILAEKYPEMEEKSLYSAILCGEIFVDGERLLSPKCEVGRGVEILWKKKKYVGRGGYKLEGALADFRLSPRKLVCVDAGASTGGFTDCLLRYGASTVHAVDVGYNLLVWKLRCDERVIVHERCNVMKCSRRDLIPPPLFAVADLSFRSLRGAASKLLSLVDGGTLLALVKPQYESPEEDGFKGVVRTQETLVSIIYSLKSDLEDEGVFILDMTISRLLGRRGNVEFFFSLGTKGAMSGVDAKIQDMLNRVSLSLRKTNRPG